MSTLSINSPLRPRGQAQRQLPAAALTSARRCGSYGFADVSYHAEMYGHSANVIHTPHLDALSASGVRLENYFVRASPPAAPGSGSAGSGPG